MQNILGATFADQIKLVGYDLVEYSNHELTLTLHWQALGQIPVDYKYFIHVWGENEILAQADAMPDSYNYPTSWWAPQEVFSDTVSIDIANSPSAMITLKVGLYVPNGGRIPIVDSEGSTVPSATLELGHLDLSS